MGKTLFAGPYVGEFGWELFGWQGYLRSMSKDYDKVIIATRPLNHAIYGDFADEIVSYRPQGNKTRYTKCNDWVDPDFYDKFEFDDLIPSQVMLVNWKPSGYYNVNRKYIPEGVKQKFVKYGKKKPNKGYDILVHARRTNKLKSGVRNWGGGNWLQLVDRLRGYHIASIGTSEGAMWVPGTDDLRDIGMGYLMDIMASSRLVMGGSSGPMHLASLCGTPHLVWSTPINRTRYTRDWNPFNTKCIFYDKEGFKPSVDSIEKLARDYMELI